MKNKLLYTLRSGKNNKMLYYASNYARLLVPRPLFQKRLKSALLKIENRDDRDDIIRRINYYCRLKPGSEFPLGGIKLKNLKPEKQKVYFFDTYQYTRWFDDDLSIGYCPGDVTFVPDIPSIVKSRPLVENNANSVVLKLDKVRHFIFVNDPWSFEKKASRAIFRGKVLDKQQRIDFMDKFYGHPLVDAGDVGRRARAEWVTEKMTIGEHLKYKFIMAIEGNDVASNLKWVMSSNSLAVMPRPTCETWFMEGTLLPDVHYVEVLPDFSNLEERMEYYSSHQSEAKEIIENAHRYVDSFRDKARENLISLGVLYKYFRATGQIERIMEDL